MSGPEKTTVDRWLVEVAGVGSFQTKSGGQPTNDAWTDFDAGADQPDVGIGKTTYSDLVTGRTYAPARDQPTRRRFDDPRMVGWETVVTATPLNQRGAIVEEPTTYRVKFRFANDPDTDANDSAKGQFTMTWSVLSRS